MASRYMIVAADSDNNYLSHHGIKGQKWGVRRFQDADGTWTDAGKKRYSGSVGGTARRALAKVYDVNAKFYDKTGNKTLASMNRAAATAQRKKADQIDNLKNQKIGHVAKAKKLTYKEQLSAQNYQKYSKNNLPIVAIGKHYSENAKYWKSAIKNIREMDSGKGKAFINAYLDQPMHVSGLTGTSDTTMRKRMSGKFTEFY